jgi:hypothetical protein
MNGLLSCGGATPRQRHGKHIAGERLVGTITDSPARGAAAAKVQHGGHIDPALTRAYEGDISDPNPIRARTGERLTQAIGCCQYSLIGTFGTQITQAATAANVHLDFFGDISTAKAVVSAGLNNVASRSSHFLKRSVALSQKAAFAQASILDAGAAALLMPITRSRLRCSFFSISGS